MYYRPVASAENSFNIINAVAVLANSAAAGTTDVVVLVDGYNSLKFRRSATGAFKIDMYGPKVDGTKGPLLTTITGGSSDFTTAVDVKCSSKVFVTATDTSAAGNTITVDAYIGQ